MVDRPARVSVQARSADRWSLSRAPKRAPAVMLMVAGASLALHGLIVATLVLSGRTPPPPPPREIAVEIVQDVPKPPPAAPPVKAEPAKPEPMVPKAEAAKIEPPKPEPAKPEPPKPEPPKPAAAKPPPPPAEASQLAALQKELAALKAEHDALASPQPAAPPAGRGALENSLPAIALPSAGDGTGEVASYEAIVFSQLAKAKDIGRKQGKPGTSGVRFEIDDAGQLVSADIITPSGIAALDTEALDIVHKAAPFPPPPKGAQRQFVANVNFVPQDGP